MHTGYMSKPTKWTPEALKQESSKYSARGELKRNNPAAYKAARQRGMLSALFPDLLRKTWTKEMATEVAKSCTSRSDLQMKNPYAYVFIKKAGLMEQLFPEQKNKKKWPLETLREEAKKYTSRDGLYRGSPGAHSVACKLGLLDQLDLPVLQGTSKCEQEILEFLRALAPDFRTKRFSNDYELDCYSETLKLGVEYNGLYWHSELNRSRRYHLEKTQYFQEKGIRVIHIWEHEWRDRRPQVKNYLQSACRANDRRLGARECWVDSISFNEAAGFLEATHIQGRPHIIKAAFGVWHEGQLVGVATFGPHHRGGEEHVLNRFSCLPGVTIAGALAKVSKLANETLGDLKSWADYSKSQASGYVAAGWKVEKVLPPDYFYATLSGKYVSKQTRKKSTAGTPKGMTESEHAKKDGLYRIWDCGKIVLSYKKS